jgi:hypothetical protein
MESVVKKVAVGQVLALTTSVFSFSIIQKILHPYFPSPIISAIFLAIHTVVK